ncbi:uncharacterized protein [Linepithema humile]|uniref:uncharacterized protein n=1 Tax=Linepithema humile TaxID=83485 RepID=UPI000623B182|nr:PREDICTED: uncharacterized protein LOC105677856 [Linepithema humile]XP_012232158.1 PREDICTED: uncharacterized protein LOC105677856 [Linepithema humile]XP_012232159.1 PREDICTED: uncharacterized protein LOC105677856 [Linepithema humile]
MYISSINSFVASWLFLCLINPHYSRAERSYWVPYYINDPVHRESRPIQSVEKQFQSNVPESSQHNIYYRNYYNSVQPKVFPKDMYSEVNVKQNAAKSTSESEVGKQYKPYNYPEYRYAGNRETLKKESATYFSQMQRYEEARRKDEEIIKKMNLLDKLLSENSDENDIESKNIVEDLIVAETSIPEETKRVVRQVRKKRPGFFYTLARVAFETFNDTRSAIKQISDIISQNFEPDMPTQRPVSTNPLTIVNTTTAAPQDDQNNVSSNLADTNVTTTMRTTTTTTPPPFKFTPTGFQNLLRRNFRGLIRLFNIEWQEALNQSEISIREFQRDLGKQIGGFLRDNPNTV